MEDKKSIKEIIKLLPVSIVQVEKYIVPLYKINHLNVFLKITDEFSGFKKYIFPGPPHKDFFPLKINHNLNISYRY